MHSSATDRRSASKCRGKCPDQTLDQAFGLSEVLVVVSTSRLSCKSAGKTRTLMPVWDSSGEFSWIWSPGGGFLFSVHGGTFDLCAPGDRIAFAISYRFRSSALLFRHHGLQRIARMPNIF